MDFLFSDVQKRFFQNDVRRKCLSAILTGAILTANVRMRWLELTKTGSFISPRREWLQLYESPWTATFYVKKWRALLRLLFIREFSIIESLSIKRFHSFGMSCKAFLLSVIDWWLDRDSYTVAKISLTSAWSGYAQTHSSNIPANITNGKVSMQ